MSGCSSTRMDAVALALFVMTVLVMFVMARFVRMHFSRVGMFMRMGVTHFAANVRMVMMRIIVRVLMRMNENAYQFVQLQL